MYILEYLTFIYKNCCYQPDLRIEYCILRISFKDPMVRSHDPLIKISYKKRGSRHSRLVGVTQR